MTENPASPNRDTWLQQLQSPDEVVATRLDAASRLAGLNDPAVLMVLLQTLQTEADPRVLIHVIGLLGKKQAYSAVMPLIDLVLATGNAAIELAISNYATSDTGIRVRIAAIQALGRMGDERAIVPMMSILGNQKENYRIRLSAAENLGRLGDQQAVQPLLHIVQDEQETSHYLKESAVKALGMLGDIRALDPLLDMFEAQKGLKNKFNFLKEQIVEALGHFGRNRRSVDALLKALEDDAAPIRLSAVEALAEVGDLDCVSPIKKRLYDAEDDVAIAACSTLFQLGGESLIRAVLEEQDNLPQFIREELETYVP